MEEPSPLLYKDYRYIITETELINKIIDFPIEINCICSAEIHIKNCEFKKGLKINVDYGVEINSIFIFRSDIVGDLNLYGGEHDCNKVKNNVGIDSCNVDNINFIGLSPKELNIYLSDIYYLNIESSNFNGLVIEDSSIGIFTYIGSIIKKLDINEGAFKKYNIVPKNLYNIIYEKNSIPLSKATFSSFSISGYKDFIRNFKSIIKHNKENKIFSKKYSLTTIDFLLSNENTVINISELNDLYYERNKIQTSSLVIKSILWLFGYFQNPTRYFFTFIILLSVFTSFLNIITHVVGEHLNTLEILKVVTNSFIGLSYTANPNVGYVTSIILSLYIGAGTMLYSGLLVTLINRFKIRF